MKKMMIVWFFLIICLVGTLYFIGFNVNKEYKPYREFEEDLKEKASVYLTLKEIKLSNGKSLEIKLKDLKEINLITDLKVNEDNCDGYVLVKKTYNDYEYKPYIKCKNYTSVDFKE